MNSNTKFLEAVTSGGSALIDLTAVLFYSGNYSVLSSLHNGMIMVYRPGQNEKLLFERREYEIFGRGGSVARACD